MAETTLILRLAGPMQSWGEVSKFLTRGTMPYPSYAGILGLCRAALGYGRKTDEGFDELRSLSVVLRVDRRGTMLKDFHSINPPEPGMGEYTVPNGSGKGWMIEGTAYPLITHRYYLTDAVFTVFLTGDSGFVTELSAAMREPHWHVSLGRKACIPDFPLHLGLTQKAVTDLIGALPVVDVNARPSDDDGVGRPVDVHWLTGRPDVSAPDVLHADDPRGPHPQDGYRIRTRWINRTDFTAPAVISREELLTWVSEHLNGVSA